MVLNGGPHFEHTPAASISVLTKDQAETDRLCAAVIQGGGSEGRCGWATDRFGVSWQIVPEVIPRFMNAGDKAAAERVHAAMMKMGKLDIAALEAAFETPEGGVTMTTETNAPAEVAAQSALHAVSPHLVCQGAAKAIDFYERAFGATRMMVMHGPDGKLLHGCISINGSSVMLVDENPDFGLKSPKLLGGTPVRMHLVVDDADATAATAVAAGATVVMPVADMFWGDRYGVIEDPFGHHWSIATPKGEPMTEAQLQQAARDAFA